MSRGYYRLTVITCVLSWFLVGLHLPTLHQMTHHGRVLPSGVVAVVATLAVVALAGLWVLLRAPAPRTGPAGGTPAA